MSKFVRIRNKLINLDHVTLIEKMEKGDNEKIKFRFNNGHIVHVDEQSCDFNKLSNLIISVPPVRAEND